MKRGPARGYTDSQGPVLGLDPATTAAQVEAIQHWQQLCQNPLVNMAYTFIEPFPVGLIITLISAAMLRRKAPSAVSAAMETHRQAGV